MDIWIESRLFIPCPIQFVEHELTLKKHITHNPSEVNYYKFPSDNTIYHVFYGPSDLIKDKLNKSSGMYNYQAHNTINKCGGYIIMDAFNK